MKKTDYNTKTQEELEAELKTLKQSIAASLAKGRTGKATKEYVVARKNVARILTALSAMPAVIVASSAASSTESEK